MPVGTHMRLIDLADQARVVPDLIHGNHPYEEFRRGEYDTGILARVADRLLPGKTDGSRLTCEQEIALAAAAVWQLERDERTALAPAAQAAPRESAWARVGRLSALRRNE